MANEPKGMKAPMPKANGLATNSNSDTILQKKPLKSTETNQGKIPSTGKRTYAYTVPSPSPKKS